MNPKTFLDYVLTEPEELRLVPKPKTAVKTRRERKARVEPRMLRTKEAARYIGVSEWKLRQMVYAEEIAVIRSKYWLFAIDDLDKWIARERR